MSKTKSNQNVKSTFGECNNQRTGRVQQNAVQVKLYYGLGNKKSASSFS